MDHENFIPRNILSRQWFVGMANRLHTQNDRYESRLVVSFIALMSLLSEAASMSYWLSWVMLSTSISNKFVRATLDGSIACRHALRSKGKVCPMTASHRASCWRDSLEPLSRTQRHCLYQQHWTYLVIGWAWFMHDSTTKILSAKICFWTEFGQTAKYLILENFRLYGISWQPDVCSNNLLHISSWGYFVQDRAGRRSMNVGALLREGLCEAHHIMKRGKLSRHTIIIKL
jgi:hypothetical protein